MPLRRQCRARVAWDTLYKGDDVTWAQIVASGIREARSSQGWRGLAHTRAVPHTAGHISSLRKWRQGRR
eukprot:4619558-Pyramimonas_sp.AAC.1